MNSERTNIFLMWNILRECNFACSYCFLNAPSGTVSKIDIDKIVERLNRFKTPLLIHITGGEPFLIPNFTELIEKITIRNQIRLDTNLSLRNACEKFANQINPKKVIEICFSTHVLEWKKGKNGINQLLSNVKMFQNKGFKMIGNYVAYPPLMHRIQDDIHAFNKMGINVLPSFFWGNYNEKYYPIQDGNISYSKEEFQLLKTLNPDINSHLFNTKGTYCQAGSTAFAMNPNYEVYPCNAINKKLGYFFDGWKTFDKVIRCPSNYCLSPLNRAPAVTLFPVAFPTEAMLRETISDKGIFSKFNSNLNILSIKPKFYINYLFKEKK